MKHLSVLNKYFLKYKWHLLLGIVFVTVSNVFAVLPPKVIRNVLDEVYNNVNFYHLLGSSPLAEDLRSYVVQLVMKSGLLLLAYALLKGIFMFFMRQTIIVMSRHIEFDQKNEIFNHYQKLSTSFYKQNATGDLMNRISEDVSRVRQYVGPAIMYIINLVVLICMSLWGMLSVSPSLTLYAIAPLPILAFAIFYVNKIVNRKSEVIQAELSNLTTNAQEYYSGIRVIKSYGQEKNALKAFTRISEKYRKSAISLSATEAVYFPAMNLFIGLSVILTVLIGGYQAMQGYITPGNIAEFVIYIQMMMFPISAIGWTANMVQRAAASQKRINEFLLLQPEIENTQEPVVRSIDGKIEFKNVSFRYPNTGIQALKNFSLVIHPGEKVAILGKTGSGKSTLAHLMLRMYDVDEGEVYIDDIAVRDYQLSSLRKQISYVPQDVFLFSDTISNNISLGTQEMPITKIKQAAELAVINKEIEQLPDQYNTITGERGVMLSGGQKQRISIARAITKPNPILIIDDSLSAVDTSTEQAIQANLRNLYPTAIIISHRIFTSWNFDKIIVLDRGQIKEIGTHQELMKKDGYYAKLYNYQTRSSAS